jgi:hypothetical protein
MDPEKGRIMYKLGRLFNPEKKTDNNKYASLLRYGIKYVHNNFYGTGPQGLYYKGVQTH